MNASEVQKAWEYLGEVEEQEVADAWLQVRLAFQLIGAAGSVVRLPPETVERDFEWSTELCGFISESVFGDPQVRVGLAMADLSLIVTDIEHGILDRFALDGQTLQSAFAWLKAALEIRSAEMAELPGEFDAQLAAHPVARGAPFTSGSRDSYKELSRYYSNASRCLDFASGLTGEPSAVRVSPADLQIATTLTLEANGEAPIKTIEIAFRSDDEADDKFCFTVRPFPVPEVPESELTELEGGGSWQTEGGFGAILSIADCRFYDAEPMQADAATMFLESAIDGLLDITSVRST